MKKGFTLLEIVVSLAIMSIISVMALKQLAYHKINSDINNMIEKIDDIIEISLFSSTGYPSSTGDPCSTGYNYLDVSAVRINSCSDLNLNITGELDPLSINGKDGTQSQIEDDIILGGYLGSPIIKISGNPLIDENFYLYLDFSNLTDLSIKKKEYIEENLESHFQRKFTSNFINVYRNATDVNVDIIDIQNGGLLNDGKITFEFKN